MDYSDYILNNKEKIIGLLEYVFLCSVFAFFFYRSVIAFIVFLPGVFYFRKIYIASLITKRKKKLSTEFSQTLYSVISGLKAGYSIENAFIEAKRDAELFFGSESLMVFEIQIIKSGLNMHMNLEDLIEDLGTRSGDEEILLFADVFKCAKRNGGNITEVLSETADRIQERICIDREIDLLISEKLLELRIMEVVPFVILIYLDITSRGYFDILYEGLRGRFAMTICLMVYIAAAFVAEKIVRIKV